MVFDTTILGSNPSAPARQMNIINSKNSLIKKIKNKFFPFYKSKEIKIIFDILEKNKAEDKNVVMFVGGCVRKHIQNEVIDDIDLATTLSPDEVKKKFINTQIKVIETGITHGSLTLILNEKKFEITSLRKDIKTDGRHAEISFTDNWQLDSERRDFTLNAIYLDQKGNIFDPQLGLNDLKRGIIKFIGDPNKRIEEDYLRIIRFIRFALQYNHKTFENSTLEAIKLNLNGIKKLSKERILSELFKILTLKNFLNINKNKEIKNIFSIIFPEFKYISRLEKFDLIKNNLKLNKTQILAVLLIENSNNVEYFCHKYNVSNILKEKLFKISELYNCCKEDKNFFKSKLKTNIYLFGKDSLRDLNLLIFFINKKMNYEKEFLKNFKLIEQVKLPKFPYDGNYLINKGLSEGIKVGQILKELEKDWIDNNFSIKEKDVDEKISKLKL